MNPQIKQKWVSALRSGEYQQTQRYLHKEDGFCCLGVLCDLYIKENNVEWELLDVSTHYEFQSYEKELPLSVIDWAGVEDANPYIIGVGTSLASLNDTGSTFNEIADVIEEHL
jgi:hypothetical protein